MLFLNVSFHVARVHKVLPAVLTVEGLVEMIAERFSAEFFVTDSTDEVFGIALQVLALMQRLLAFGGKDCVAISAK